MKAKLFFLKQHFQKSILFLIFSLMIGSCTQIDLFEKQAQIPSQQWFYDNVPQFTFHIQDTAATYHLYVVLRHTDLYQYNNIWLQIGSQAPGDSMKFQKLNLSLADDMKGWEGTGMDDIYEVRKNISAGGIGFKKQGDYTFSIAQIMRDNPLRYILNVGFRIEKVEN